MKKGMLLKGIVIALFLFCSCVSSGELESIDESEEMVGILTVAPELTRKLEAFVTVTPKPQYANYKVVTLDEEMGYRYVEGGVIITIKNGLYGAVDYESNTIAENIYKVFWASPCKEGYFALSNDKQVFVFDKTGNIACSINLQDAYWQLDRLHISDGVVSYNYRNRENTGHSLVCIYDLKNARSVMHEEYDDSDMTAVTAMREGNVYFSAGKILYATDVNGIVTEVYSCAGKEKDVEQRVYFEQAPHNGYGVLHMEGEEEIESQVGLYNIEDREVCLCSIKNMIEELGIEEAYSYYVHTYYEDGQFLANCKNLMVIGFYNEHGTVLTEVLLDFSKAKFSTSEEEGKQETVMDNKISNISDIMVANYDYIELSSLGIHYVWNDGCAFYIDNEGTVLNEYKRCSNFLQGYAMVVDDNKKAYMVDGEFNKVSELFDAESVVTLGSAFGLYTDMQLQMLIIME